MTEPKGLERLLENNRGWVAERLHHDPRFFSRLSGQQAPEFLWIGCSDSRVPANQITGLDPGEVFVHRNVANVVVHSDLNLLSVLQFGIDVLRIQHIIVCGHYGCAGIHAAITGTRVGLADNWLRHVADIAERHEDELAALPMAERLRLMCRLNVAQQVRNVARTSVVVDAWARGQALSVNGLVYDLHDGILQNLDITVNGPVAG